MAAGLDRAMLDVHCPRCNHHVKMRFGALSSSRLFACAGCGTRIPVDDAELNRIAGEIRRNLAQTRLLAAKSGIR